MTMNLLMLRGLAREQRHWENFPQILEKKCKDLKTHCLDLPGMGTEWRRSSPTTIRGITEDLRYRLDGLREAYPGEWHLLAVSLGGMIGMDWCFHYPHDFDSFVMINSSDSKLSPFYERLQLHVVPKIMMSAFDRDPVRRELRSLTFTTNMQKDLTGLAQRWADFQKQSPLRVKNVWNQLMAAKSFRTPPQLEVPLMILDSKKDHMVNPKCSERLAEHFKAKRYTHLMGGHDLSLDDPEWVALKVQSWIKQLAIAS